MVKVGKKGGLKVETGVFVRGGLRLGKKVKDVKNGGRIQVRKKGIGLEEDNGRVKGGRMGKAGG